MMHDLSALRAGTTALIPILDRHFQSDPSSEGASLYPQVRPLWVQAPAMLDLLQSLAEFIESALRHTCYDDNAQHYLDRIAAIESATSS